MSELKPFQYCDGKAARLIDANTLLDEIKHLKIFLAGESLFTPAIKETVMRTIEEQATVEIGQPANEPLTLEQLSEMDGEPVFALDVDNSGIAEGGEWLIICSGLLYGVDMQDDLHDYGKTWLAYRRKPESDLPTHANTSGVRPKCFYSDTASEFCLGMAHGDDDYPVRECEKCWYLDANEDLRQTKEREQNE